MACLGSQSKQGEEPDYTQTTPWYWNLFSLCLFSHFNTTGFAKHPPMHRTATFEGLQVSPGNQARTHPCKPGSPGYLWLPSFPSHRELARRCCLTGPPRTLFLELGTKSRDPLGSAVLFTISSLQIHEPAMTFHLFRSFLISFINFCHFQSISFVFFY